MPKVLLYIIFLLFSPISFLSGQPINKQLNFRHIQVNQGLSENTVNCILEDSKGFMWFGTKDGLNQFNGYEFKIYRHSNQNPNSLGNSFIHSLAETDDGQIWAGTDNGLSIFDPINERFAVLKNTAQDGVPVRGAVYSILAGDKTKMITGTSIGIFLFDRQTQKLTHYGTDVLPSNTVWTILKDRQGIIWIGTRSGLVRYEIQSNTFTKTEINAECLSLYEDNANNIWIGTWESGLICFNKTTQQSIRFFDKQDKDYVTHIRAIFPYSGNELLIGADDGLYLFNTHTHNYYRIDNPQKIYSLSDRNVYCIDKDKEGGIWIGTYFGGINYLPPNHDQFELYSPNHTDNSICGKAVSQFCEDEAGNLWIATEDGGLSYYDPKTGIFQTSQETPYHFTPSYHNIHALALQDDKLWIGTFSRGLDMYDFNTRTLHNFRHIEGDSSTLNDNAIFSLLFTKTRVFYIGTPFGLERSNPENNTFTQITEVKGFIYDIFEDSRGTVWIASYGNGVYRMDASSASWINFQNNPSDNHSLCGDKIINIFEDSKGAVWFASEGYGISKYIPASNSFVNYNEADGLPNNVVYGILEDGNGFLWLSTNKGLAKFYPETKAVKVYTQNDGLQSNEFNYRSSFKASDGKFYFGGINGFNSFYPEQIVDNSTIPPVVITKIQLLHSKTNTSVDSLINRCLNSGTDIELSHNNSSFTIYFASLSYANPESNQYSYYMEGIDEKWSNITNKQSITYANLSPGKYIFHVKASNNNDVWNEEGAKAAVIILPPVYWRWYAKLFYLIILMICGYLLLKYYNNRIRERHDTQMKELKTKAEQENYNAKISLFTQIAHEIRTPLTLISAPLAEIMKSNGGTPETKDNLQIIDRNTKRLTALANELLDFNKVENSNRLYNEILDLTELISSLCVDFNRTATQKNITLTLQAPEETVYVSCDKNLLNKIISNLLSNALKYAKDKVDIALEQSENTKETNLTKITVSDNGPGIPPEMQSKIFEPFFQVANSGEKQGIGLGLSIVKQSIDKLGGTIAVDFSENQGAVFTVSLQCNKVVPLPEPAAPLLSSFQEETDNQSFDAHQPIILLIEDNEELCHFLIKNLKGNYHLVTANDGLQGIEKLKNAVVNLIICDIMMPNMTGIEFINYIKESGDYEHIPIIILSAKTNMQDKLEGLKAGADAYIEKPFSLDFLKAQISTLIKNRETMLQKFMQTPLASFATITNSAKEKHFIEALNKVIEQNISNEDISITQIAGELSMSRSSFQRKIKGILNLTPNEYINLVRLKKAARLLIEEDYRINEICFLVGFSSPSYFTKCFQKQFNILPKEWVKAHTKS